MPVEGGLYYTHCADGAAAQLRPPLLLIHGAGGTHLHWPPEMRRMKEATVYAIDLPGHGRSQGEALDSILEYARCLKSWMDALAMEKAIFVGHSMGGAIAQTMALEFPARIVGLVLVGSGAKLRVHPKILELAANAVRSQQVAELITQWAFGEHADRRLIELGKVRYAEARPRSMHADFLACDRFDIMERLGEIRVATLVVCGAEDQLTPPKYSQYLAQKIEHSSLVIIEDAGHMVMLEKPAEVAAELRRFVDSHFF